MSIPNHLSRICSSNDLNKFAEAKDCFYLEKDYNRKSLSSISVNIFFYICTHIQTLNVTRLKAIGFLLK